MFTCIMTVHIITIINAAKSSHFTALDIQKKQTQITQVINKMFACSSTKRFSLSEHLRDIFDCASPYIMHCRPTTKTFTVSSVSHYSLFSFCGNIQILPVASLNAQLFLHVLRQHILQFQFISFDFYRTFQKCGPDELHLRDFSIHRTHVYCGVRVPWTIITTGRKCSIMIKISSGFTSTLKLFYNAIYKPHIDSVMMVGDWSVLREWLGNTFLQKTFAHSFTVSGSPYEIIHFSVIWRAANDSDNITVFDGPGSNSPIIMTLDKNVDPGVYKTTTSAYSMFILVKRIAYMYNATIFNIQKANSRTIRICKSPHRHITDKSDSFSLNSKSINYNFACRYKVSVFTYYPYITVYLNEFAFFGADTLDSLNNEVCSYGGFFIRVFNTNSSFIDTALCRSVSHFAWNPNTSRIDILAIWYQGYSHGHVEGRITYDFCPTTRLVDNVLMSDFDQSAGCHIYVCYDNSCRVQLARQGGSIGPSLLQIKRNLYLESNSDHKLHDFKGITSECESQVQTWSRLIKQWMLDKSIYRRYLFSRSHMHHKVNFNFLHNLTAYIKKCHQDVVVEMGLVTYQCGKATGNLISPRTLMSLYQYCTTRESSRKTFYHPKPTGVEIILLVKRSRKCDPLCAMKTIIIFEAMLDEGFVYKYNFSFSNQFKWHTHRKQGGFSFTIHQQNKKCATICDIYVVTELAKKISTKRHMYHHQVFPMG